LPYAKPVSSVGRRPLHGRHLEHELHRTSVLRSKPRSPPPANSCGKHTCEHRSFLAVPKCSTGRRPKNRCTRPALSAHAWVDEWHDTIGWAQESSGDHRGEADGVFFDRRDPNKWVCGTQSRGRHTVARPLTSAAGSPTSELAMHRAWQISRGDELQPCLATAQVGSRCGRLR
jgi:hypothetical protein